jgi:HD-GYP domain-containing protein (c-di-GMP phosphodiesterase class II)
MKIIETEYPDITESNIDESKIILANNIIKNVYPLFDEVYGQKLSEESKLKKTILKRKQIVEDNKKNLEIMMKQYDRKKKVAKLLSRLEKLVDSGLVYGGHLKAETIVLLKIIDKLPDEKLDYHLAETLKTIGKRFSKE